MARAPGAPKGGFTFGNVPAPPEVRFGGVATDISQGLGSTAERLREIDTEEDVKAFRDAQAALEQERFESEQALTRETEAGRLTQRQTEEARRGTRFDIELAEANRRAEEAQAFQESQALLDRALQRELIATSQGQGTQERRDAAGVARAQNLRLNNRSEAQTVSELMTTFGVVEKTAQGWMFLADAENAKLREQQARAQPGGIEGMLDLGGGPDPRVGFPETPQPGVSPFVQRPPEGTPGVGPVAAPAPPPAPQGSVIEEFVLTLDAGGLSGDDILNVLESQAGAGPEEIAEAMSIMEEAGIEFTRTEQDGKTFPVPGVLRTGEAVGERAGDFLKTAFSTGGPTEPDIEGLFRRLQGTGR